MKVPSYRLLKACACLRADIRFYHHHMFCRLLKTVLLVPLVIFLQKGKLIFSSSAPQTNRICISTCFELWTKGSLAFLNFFFGRMMMVVFDRPITCTTLLQRTVKVLVPVSLYGLELFLAGSVTVLVMYMK